MKTWYNIRAADDDGEAEILIYDEIGKDFWGEGVLAEDLVKELAGIKAATLNVRINSIGGQVFEGLAIFNALQRHPATVLTHIDGIAASIASVVALAGDEVRVAENAFFMVHNPWGFVIGNAIDMRDMAETLDKLAGSIAGTYMSKTEASEEQVQEWMDAETWFNAEEAKEAGFVDEITEAAEIKAGIDLSMFANVPTQLSAQITGGGEPEPVIEPEPEPAGPDLDFVQLAAASLRTLSETRL